MNGFFLRNQTWYDVNVNLSLDGNNKTHFLDIWIWNTIDARSFKEFYSFSRKIISKIYSDLIGIDIFIKISKCFWRITVFQKKMTYQYGFITKQNMWVHCNSYRGRQHVWTVKRAFFTYDGKQVNFLNIICHQWLQLNNLCLRR